MNSWGHTCKYIDSVHVKDLFYGEGPVMAVYEISDDHIIVRFAAGEFSNCVWGIYLPAIKT